MVTKKHGLHDNNGKALLRRYGSTQVTRQLFGFLVSYPIHRQRHQISNTPLIFECNLITVVSIGHDDVVLEYIPVAHTSLLLFIHLAIVARHLYSACVSLPKCSK